jgi:hypothetical protein
MQGNMKFKMSPARMYFLGMWKTKRTDEGVGVEGKRELCEAFLAVAFAEKFALPNKVKYREEKIHKCYFYNTALRAWLDAEMEKRDERLKYKNDFAASYFAGIFDAAGGWLDFAKRKLPYVVGDKVDEIVLMRLGFRVKREGAKLIVLSDDFYSWIKPHLRLSISQQ